MNNGFEFKDLTPWILYIIVLLGSLSAFLVAFNSERRIRNTNIEGKIQDSVRKAEASRQEYIDSLEGRIDLFREEVGRMRDELQRALARITVLEVSEENCQKERVTLMAENSSLRRRIEILEAKNA